MGASLGGARNPGQWKLPGVSEGHSSNGGHGVTSLVTREDFQWRGLDPKLATKSSTYNCPAYKMWWDKGGSKTVELANQ